jgi:cytochrome c-type biogenesis protein CcmH
MLLWISFAVLSAAVLIAVLRPLWSARRPVGAGHPTEIYRDQLAEIDAEVERGLLSAGEAEEARIEIARRLLASESRSDRPRDAASASRTPARAVRLATVLGAMVPLLAIGLYLVIGSPAQPDQPLAMRARPPVEAADLGKLVAAVEKRLAEKPDDGQGWDVIAPVYLRQGRYPEAVNAYSRALALLGDSPRRLAGFAEATVLQNEGLVTEPARAAYEKLARLEPKRFEPRFWLALAKEQSGRASEAVADFRALLADAEPDAPWRPLVEERIAILEGRASEAAAPRAQAPDMSSADRQRMIEDMVQGLAERLKSQGNDLPGWQRLIRAYVVMGRKDDALAALKAARGNFTDEPGSLSALTELARALGLET